MLRFADCRHHTVCPVRDRAVHQRLRAMPTQRCPGAGRPETVPA
jgi:hypothetical protein